MQGAQEEWDVGVRVVGGGTGSPAAASHEPPPLALRGQEVVRGLPERPLPCRARCPTSGSHRRVKASGFLGWTKPSRLGQAVLLGHQGTASPLPRVTGPGLLPRAHRGDAVGMRPSSLLRTTFSGPSSA